MQIEFRPLLAASTSKTKIECHFPSRIGQTAGGSGAWAIVYFPPRDTALELDPVTFGDDDLLVVAEDGRRLQAVYQSYVLQLSGCFIWWNTR